MILDKTTLKLEAILAGAVSANQPECHVDFITWNSDGAAQKPQTFRVALNSANDVTILAAPATTGFALEPIRISIYNKDTASATVTVKTDDGTNERILIKATLLTLECLNWERDQGWYALDANGNRKEVTGSIFSSITIGGGSSLTNFNEGTQASTFTWDGTGGTSGSLTMTYQKINNMVKLNIPAASATTGTGSTVLTSDTALPAAIRPTTQQDQTCSSLKNNAAAIASAGVIRITTGGLVKILRDGAATAFTNTAAAGTNANTTVEYFIG